MEGKGATLIFSYLHNFLDSPQAAGVVGTVDCCAFLYHSGILNITFLDLKDDILFYKVSFLCVCVCMYV